MRATVVGGGNAGFGLSAALKLRGWEVALLEAPEFEESIEPVLQEGGIRIRGIVGEGLAELDTVTTQAEEALTGSSLVFVCVPAYAHSRMTELIGPHLTEDQLVLLMPGNCGGALAFVQRLQEMGRMAIPVVAEGSSFLFACKKEGDAGVWVRGLKDGMPVAAFPGKETDRAVEALQEAFPELGKARDVMETSLTNLNHMVHPPGILLNLGLVELAEDDWSFFFEGLSPGVCEVIEAMDRERLEIVTQFNLEPIDTLEWMERFYGHQGFGGETLFEALSTTPIHGPSRGPRTLQHRYITEDIPYGLVPLASIGHEMGIDTTAIDAMVDLASILSGTDWRAEGWTADNLGLSGLSASEMLAYVTEGSI